MSLFLSSITQMIAEGTAAFSLMICAEHKRMLHISHLPTAPVWWQHLLWKSSEDLAVRPCFPGSCSHLRSFCKTAPLAASAGSFRAPCSVLALWKRNVNMHSTCNTLFLRVLYGGDTIWLLRPKVRSAAFPSFFSSSKTKTQVCVQRCAFAWKVAVQLRLYWTWINARWRLSGLTRNEVANMPLHYLRQLADQSMHGASDLSILTLRQ